MGSDEASIANRKPEIVYWRGGRYFAQWYEGSARVRLSVHDGEGARSFYTTADKVSETPDAAPAPALTPARPEPEIECLECGATYPTHKAHLVDVGGMGCARCNR